MTIEDIKKLDKDILTPADVAPLLHCDPNVIRLQAKQDIKQLGFPASKIGTRIKIPKEGFIKWITNFGFQGGGIPIEFEKDEQSNNTYAYAVVDGFRYKGFAYSGNGSMSEGWVNNRFTKPEFEDWIKNNWDKSEDI